VAGAITVTEAKAQLSRLIERALGGEEIVIRRGARPVAKLVAYTPERRPREPGDLRGRIRMSDDFTEPLEELPDEFGIGS
jgi:prevent-host-death family protein